ncbi:DNA-packaging protein [Henriciella mobilis]|uniref:DNA-packaging protein n=1 Tax=Henriciella mobilis TaxID=2305467 RepID=UPI001F45C4C6|nr:terminase family protein [Henriciella mobilis]
MTDLQPRARPGLPFLLSARGVQCDPPGDWRTWLFMGGRGSGKTRAGAEWVRRLALFGGARRIALVGPTFSDVREVMIEGVSGLRAIVRPGELPPYYQASRHRLIWPNGAAAYAFSAEDPDGLRGPQFDAAWCDEAAAWRNGRDVWDMLQMTLRLGTNPRAMVTTTPKPVQLIRQLVKDPSVAITRSSTRANAQHLSPAFLSHVERTYANTKLGRQELDGELLDAPESVLWTRALIDRVTLGTVPGPLSDVIIAVDPPAGTGLQADACGIVAVGLRRMPGAPDTAFVLGDATVRSLPPHEWASRVVSAASRTGASRIIAEANQGGEMIRSILYNAGCHHPVTLRHARLSKHARAMPVGALYEQGRVFHIGGFPELEEEMMAFGTAAMKGSPDRVDALVWAVTALLLDDQGEPSIQRL